MDKERILSLLSLLENYVKELHDLLPPDFSKYTNLQNKRFIERTLQLAIEVCIDISKHLLKGLRLGLPAEEESVFEGLKKANIITPKMHSTLREMKKFRNILIRRYAEIDDLLVYKNAKRNQDFIQFKTEIISFLKKK